MASKSVKAAPAPRKAAKKAATPATVAPQNPLIDGVNAQTIHNADAVITYVQLTVPEYADHGSNPSASYGLSLILQCVSDALEHAESEASNA